MNETYQNRITDQICKIQNDRALIAFYDRLRYAPLGNYAQLHAKGEYQENGHKVHSLICITIQDYSKPMQIMKLLFKRRKHSLRESNANSVFFGCIILLMQRNSAEILHYARTGKK